MEGSPWSRKAGNSAGNGPDISANISRRLNCGTRTLFWYTLKIIFMQVQGKIDYRVLLLAGSTDESCPAAEVVRREGISCQVGPDLVSLQNDRVSDGSTDAVLLDLSTMDMATAGQFVKQCRDLKVPVLAIVPLDDLSDFDPELDPDELMVSPFHPGELAARIRQAIFRVGGPVDSQLLKIGDLTIDLERYDVSVAGRRLALTYKEFQLLVLLASNPGRVYTREALLSQVWGYDYLGGTRTVDVHVRRLRSKIEEPGRTFVETIWNVGYRFKASS